MREIEIFDTTLRDGEQSPGASMTAPARLRIAKMLDCANVSTIEAGFPAAAPMLVNSIAQITTAVQKARVAVLARCLVGDIELAASVIKPALRGRIHVFIATSDLHLKYKLRISRERAIEMAVEGVRLARQGCDDVEFSAEDATRTDPQFLVKVLAAVIHAGAHVVNIPDTVGYTTPKEFECLIRYIRRKVDGIQDVVLSAHTHNDLGMATANALAAIRAGASQVECTINGVGERAGNAALEEIVCALRARRDHYDCDTSVDTANFHSISRAVSLATRMPVQKNKAIVGANAFAHESGIHQDGVLKHRSTYEVIDPATVGKTTRLLLGRNSGRHAIFDRLRHLGFELSSERRAEVLDAFNEIAMRYPTITDSQLIALMRR